MMIAAAAAPDVARRARADEVLEEGPREEKEMVSTALEARASPVQRVHLAADPQRTAIMILPAVRDRNQAARAAAEDTLMTSK